MLHLARASLTGATEWIYWCTKLRGDFVDSVPSGIAVVALETAPRWRGGLHASRAARPSTSFSLRCPYSFRASRKLHARCLPALVRYLREEEHQPCYSQQTRILISSPLGQAARRGVSVHTVISVSIFICRVTCGTGPRDAKRWRWRSHRSHCSGGRTSRGGPHHSGLGAGLPDDLTILVGLSPERRHDFWCTIPWWFRSWAPRRLEATDRPCSRALGPASCDHRRGTPDGLQKDTSHSAPGSSHRCGLSVRRGFCCSVKGRCGESLKLAVRELGV